MKLRQDQQRSIIAGSYAAILLMTLLAVWNPSVPLGAKAVDLLLLMDESSSVDQHFNDRVWQSFLQQVATLPPNSRISLLRFAGRARMEIPWRATGDAGIEELAHHTPRLRALDPSATSIGPALISAIEHTSPGRRSVVLLSSDGIDNVDPTAISFPVANNNPNLSIYYLEAAAQQYSADVQITSINRPSRSSPGQPLPLSIAVKSETGGQGSIETLLNNAVISTVPLVLAAGERRVLYHDAVSEESGMISLEFMVRDEHGNVVESHRRVVDNSSEKQLLFVGRHRSLDAISSQTRREEWTAVSVQPHLIPLEERFFHPFDAILIDDVEASEIDPRVTRNLLRTIEHSGTGLIVLGGRHSFGSGGYRHSVLEEALPVIAEAPRQLPGAAFLFLIDKSGSMEAANEGDSRLADALRAVTVSAQSLRSGDESALLVFDRDVEILLPLERRSDILAAVDQSWPLQPSGGTRLAPALKQAIELLAGSRSEQRHLVLVTDGFVDGEGLEPLKAALQTANIRLIVLAIGSDADLSTLRALTADAEARLLVVNDTAELPRFMRKELQSMQPGWNHVSATPRTLQQIPYIDEPGITWGELTGYQLTRAKASAQVYVSTDEGHPLLAAAHYGAGRVIALPGGMLQTSSGQDTLTGLLAWIDSHQQNPKLHVSHSGLIGKLTIQVDAVDQDNEWHPATTAELILRNPVGFSSSRPMEAIAPGRFEAVMDAVRSGIYSARVVIGNEQTLYSTLIADDRERRHHAMVPWLQDALASGEIKRWTENTMNELLAASYGRAPTRPFWLLLALGGYLALMTYEHSNGIRRQLVFLLQRIKRRNIA